VQCVCHPGERCPLLVITVEDTGAGIPPKMLRSLFSAYTRLQPEASVGGTGLGLCIAKELSEMLGGRVVVESVIGVGSAFSVGLPLRAPGEDASRSAALARVPAAPPGLAIDSVTVVGVSQEQAAALHQCLLRALGVHDPAAEPPYRLVWSAQLDQSTLAVVHEGLQRTQSAEPDSWHVQGSRPLCLLFVGSDSLLRAGTSYVGALLRTPGLSSVICCPRADILTLPQQLFPLIGVQEPSLRSTHGGDGLRRGISFNDVLPPFLITPFRYGDLLAVLRSCAPLPASSLSTGHFSGFTSTPGLQTRATRASFSAAYPPELPNHQQQADFGLSGQRTSLPSQRPPHSLQDQHFPRPQSPGHQPQSHGHQPQSHGHQQQLISHLSSSPLRVELPIHHRSIPTPRLPASMVIAAETAKDRSPAAPDLHSAVGTSWSIVQQHGHQAALSSLDDFSSTGSPPPRLPTSAASETASTTALLPQFISAAGVSSDNSRAEQSSDAATSRPAPEQSLAQKQSVDAEDGSLTSATLAKRKRGAPSISVAVPAHLQELRVLVADDTATNRLVLVALLRQLGFSADQLSLASDGTQAIEQYAKVPCRLVFMDVCMPGVSGLAAVVGIRRLERERKLSPAFVVMVSGSEEEAMAVVDANAVILKPVRIEHLRSMLDQFEVWLSSSSRT